MVNLGTVAAAIHKHLCECPKHGYTQGDGRWGVAGSPCYVTIEGVTYPVKDGDRDCSSSVVEAWQLALAGTEYDGVLGQGGYDRYGRWQSWYTGNMVGLFTGSGLFTQEPMTAHAVAGDVYLNVKDHTAMCQTDSPDVLSEFVLNEKGGITGGQQGDQTGHESHLRGYYDFPWDYILKYNGKADRPGREDLPECLRRFEDVNPLLWHIPYLKWAVEREIMRGTSATTLEPEGRLTRAQALAMIARADEAQLEGPPFDDLGDKWFRPYVTWAVGRGIVTTDNDSLRPDDPTTRAEMAVMLWRLAGKPEAEPLAGVHEWAAQAMGWAVAVGVMDGERQDAATTRAEAAAMLMRLSAL